MIRVTAEIDLQIVLITRVDSYKHRNNNSTFVMVKNGSVVMANSRVILSICCIGIIALCCGKHVNQEKTVKQLLKGERINE